jgi:pimeloyl-ACP methyl ester carboxylesterase
MLRLPHKHLAFFIGLTSIVLAMPAVAQMQPNVAPQTQSLPAANPLPVGQVVDAVPCASDSTETYALYLPSAYTSAKPWPIIYTFDPFGHGRTSVNLYKDAAEKYGFILTASNNSRNFQSDVTRAARALWDDTHARLNLDPRRIYTMGLSGGARVATTLAVECAICAVAGVISHGAGYPFPPSDKEHFAYFAFVGDHDFNWPEIMELRRKKQEWSAPYRLRVFAGDHEWAPPAIFAEALQWLQLKAMQTETIPRNSSFIDEQFVRTQSDAEDSARRKDIVAEFDAYRSLVFDFSGLRDVTQFQVRLNALKNSPELKEAVRKQQNAIDRQQAFTQELSSDISRAADATLDLQASLRTAIVDGMTGLKYKADHARSEDERLISIRAYQALWVQGIEAGQAELGRAKRLDKAEFYFHLISEAAPSEPWPHLLLAETAAVRGDNKRAKKELRDAIKCGLKNPDSIDNDANLQSLRKDPEFQQIVGELRAKRDSQPAQ